MLEIISMCLIVIQVNFAREKNQFLEIIEYARVQTIFDRFSSKNKPDILKYEIQAQNIRRHVIDKSFNKISTFY